MDICRGIRAISHDEIVHDEGVCPLCTAEEQIVEMIGKIEDLKITIEEMKRREA